MPQKNPRSEVIVLFVDIRGFTSWSSDIEAFEHIDEFISSFSETINKVFPDDWSVKMLGDGAMVLKELPEAEGDSDIKGKKSKHTRLLSQILGKIDKVESLFNKLCQSFSLYGYRTDLPLGWGLVRGIAKRVNGDFVGANINKCSRLCHIARPFGIVIDSDDFPEIPKKSPYNFLKQVRRLEGIANEVDVWVTEEIATKD